MCDTHTYQLIINNKLEGEELHFSHFPELNVTYIKAENHLCPSYYSSAVCIQSGNLKITLRVNDKLITLTSNDKTETIVDNYKFKGIQPLVINKSKNKTYIIISIAKCNNNNINNNDNNTIYNDNKTYNVGQPFILELSDNPTTGYSWKFEKSSGLEIINNVYSDKCEEGITGCGGTRTLVLKGNKKGNETLMAIHGRPWDPITNTKYKYTYTIV
jgi:predicted secreted protein